jgi:DNA polymerase-4
LAEQVAHDLQRKGYAGRTIGIKLRFDDFKTVTRDLTLAQATADFVAIRHAAGLCLKRVDLSRRLRLLGVRAGSLVKLQGSPPAPAATSRRSAVPPSSTPPMSEARSLFDTPPESVL